MTPAIAVAGGNLCLFRRLAGFALVLFVAGIRLSSQPVRLAGLAVLALVVLKVFVGDMSNLEGLYRIASFVGLGLCLVGIGWLYQRFVSGRNGSGHEAFDRRFADLRTASAQRRFVIAAAGDFMPQSGCGRPGRRSIASTGCWRTCFRPSWLWCWSSGFRRLPLSDVSYVLLFLFLVLHEVGAHYTYSEVPIGLVDRRIVRLHAQPLRPARAFHLRLPAVLSDARNLHPLRDAVELSSPGSARWPSTPPAPRSSRSSRCWWRSSSTLRPARPISACRATSGMPRRIWRWRSCGSLVAFALTEAAVRSGHLDGIFVPRHQSFRPPAYK